MLNQMVNFFTSAFYFPGTNWKLIILSIELSFVFGVIWLALYRPCSGNAHFGLLLELVPFSPGLQSLLYKSPSNHGQDRPYFIFGVRVHLQSGYF